MVRGVVRFMRRAEVPGEAAVASLVFSWPLGWVQLPASATYSSCGCGAPGGLVWEPPTRKND